MAIYGNNLGSGLGAEQQALLDKKLLTNIAENTMFDRFATMQKPLPLRNSKLIQFDKWIRMLDLYLINNLNQNFTGNDVNLGQETLQYTPDNEYQNFILEEGSSGTSKAQMKLIRTEATVFPIGDWMPYTEELEMFHNRWTVSETTRQMGEMAGKIIDGYYRDLYRNSAGHIEDILGESDPYITGNDFVLACNRIYDRLKLSGAKPVKSIMTSSPNYGTKPVIARYQGVIHTIAETSLRNNPNFTPIEQYASGVTPMENEIGILGHSIRVCVHENAPLTSDGSGEYIVDMLIFGNDHTAHVPVRGKNSVSFVYQPIGSSGTSDALKRVGTVGWKTWLGAKTLYPERLGMVRAKLAY
jgi:N4-gp56 family major capsid protein